ncbi:MAG: hypothetical protein IKG82_09800 [Oscillospiraceae bacterium]|nr:hypothetical protein [Oscillospiraceae bacterium]
MANYTNWKYWIDSSGHNAPPPDFYSDEFRIMMDVMRVDDHERKNSKGKTFSPHKQHEREIYQELERKGILAQFPNADVCINGWSGLPTYEDHNYTFYRKSFARIMHKHIKHIPNYKKNHPGYKVIFFVFDESTAYLQSPFKVNKQYQHTPFEAWCGDPHLYYADPVFLSSFIGRGIDYLIWFTPYKRFISRDKEADIPKICIFDLSQKHFKFKRFLEDRMESAEL